MKSFDYLRPETLEEALAALSDPDTAVLGGGTNLLDLMKLGVALPDRLVDLTRLPGLDRIETLPDGSWRIGAMVRNADLARDPGFAAAFPMVAEALLSGASAQLRNAATLGGNLMQATRCAWFQDPQARCNRRAPGSGCDALEGANRGHAVLGWTPACIAVHPSDFCVPLAALDAQVEVAGPAGIRHVPLETFHLLPGEEAHRVTALEPGEIVLALRLPAAAAAFAGHARYLKLRERTSFAFALLSAAAALRVEDGRIAEARLALGGVAARPWRCHAAEVLLESAPAAPDSFARAAAAALETAAPSGANGYKIVLAERILARALAAAAAGTPAEMPALPGSLMDDSDRETAHA
ncbi:FAD binding domain-containing protein [Mangrovicoccus algicola]|uniref:Xanthine dehydrogenase family protein subunit M n=1 Tax=Mangrovicoccus algicola TaxID=2771008 RepID=A0A8J7CHN0_9RHOB|nr:xanthine dehydrogenase family protein subunit M [Mangrovicoccus algicola]MBE3638400.1 xanthine dehydrogenase family protein subunit M [Mangrovicoccus algicola]